jgi:hypothetical protein
MKNNSFSLFVRTPAWGGRICPFRLFCVATVLVCLFSGLGLAQGAPPATITGSGTADFIPRWTGTTTLGNSNIFETVGGNVGIATTAPAAKLDVTGTGDVRDTLTLFPKLTHPTLSVHGTAFAVSNTGKVIFIAGQTFPGTGTITGVTAGTDLTGGGTSGNVTLGLNLSATDARYAQLNVSNTFGPNQSFNNSISLGGGVFPSGNVQAGGDIFATGEVVSGAELFAPNEQLSCTNCFAFLGFNNGVQQIVQTRNLDTPSTSVFEIASFNNNNTAVFWVDSLGDTVAKGTKSAVVPLKNGTEVKLFAMESPQNWFEDFGSASLVGGVATVAIDPKFSQTVNAKLDYHVFLTPNGDCHGLYVTQKTPTSFEVRELGGGQSNVAFDYRIIALRAGYEAARMPVAKQPVGAAPQQPQEASLRPSAEKQKH